MKRTWKAIRIGSLVATAIAMIMVVGCSDANPVQPNAKAPSAASNDLLGSLTNTLTSTVQKTVGLLTCKQRPAAYGAAVIGPDGGTLVVGGFTLVVPKNALSSYVTISGYAPKGNVDVIDFEPSGLVFARAASLTIDYSNCNTLGSLLPKRVAYVDGGLNILYYLPTVDDLGAQTATGTVSHFSDYAMSW
jgi:hypothetical protein